MYRFVVLIDDDPKIIFLHKYLINNMSAAEQVMSCGDVDCVEEILNLLESQEALDPSLLMLDISMPKHTGFELLELHYDRFERLVERGLRIVIASSSQNPRDLAKAESIPLITGYWEKPLTKSMIRETLAAM